MPAKRIKTQNMDEVKKELKEGKKKIDRKFFMWVTLPPIIILILFCVVVYWAHRLILSLM